VKLGGFLLCLCGMILLSAMDAVAKGLSPHLSTFEITFVRYLGSVVWLSLYIVLTRSKWPNLRNWRRHAMRGSTIIVTACLFFYAVGRLPLAIVTALSMTAPVYVAIIGIVFFKERPVPTLWVAIALGILGSLVIVFGSGMLAFEGEPLAWIAALLAPIAYASAISLVKHHSDDENAAALTLSSGAISALIVLPLAVPGFTIPTSDVWPLMVLIGFLGATGFVLLTMGLRTTPASAFAIVDYMNILWAALFGLVFFHEVPELRFWIGGGLIIAACALGAWSARRRSEAVVAP
jgi:drug/metabolite transporter (DMT)-like permease